MEYTDIEDIIRDNVPFTESPSPKGWNAVYCELCGDGHRTKGKRGGWNFMDGVAFYNCFNCGVDGNFDPKREHPYSKHMYPIFKAFSIPIKPCYDLIEKYSTTNREVKKPVMKWDNITLPSHFIPLASASEDNKIANTARKHLLEKRLIDPKETPFYISTDATSTYHNRLIIPSYVNDRLIGYEAMALGDQTTKYISMGSNLIHGYNNIYGDPDAPLFVTEGFFDSYHLRGVATTTNKLTSKQIELLERSSRLKVIVPDRGNSHNALAEKAIELGWSIALPEISPYKDVSEGIMHYGILYVVHSIMKNIRPAKMANFFLKIYNKT
jgi:hypothetical protein